MSDQKKLACAHQETTVPDRDGFVICADCLSALQRPLSMDELAERIKRPPE
jgi:hypothetical protein